VRSVKLTGRLTAVAAAGVLTVLGGSASWAAPPKSILCTLPSGTKTLPPGTRYGRIEHLVQYPDVTLATAGQRRSAARILAQLVDAAKDGNWHDLKAVARAGYKTRTAVRTPGDRSVHYFHADRGQEPRGSIILNPRRPKALIYANAPGRPFRMVGAMWSMRLGERGPTPGGPITRWHRHVVCARGNRHGAKPPPSGKCPPGESLREGPGMLHVWFTQDLRSAFSTRAPEPELCRAGLLWRDYCRRTGN
jgi:hypothetical protein